MAFGISASGFQAKSIADIQADLQAALKTQFGSEINLSASSVFGQLVGLITQPIAEVWALAGAVYGASFPLTATGQSLDNIASLTGLLRLQPTRSQVTVTATGTNGTVIPQGTVFSVQNIGTKFQTKAAATISGGVASIACESVDLGPIPAPAGTLTNVDTPVAGLAAVTNPADAVLGTALETDAQFRIRREQLLRAQGNATVEAIKSKVLVVAGVTQVTVFENVTDVTDADGLPPHSVNAVVLTPVISGATDLLVATAIFQSKAAGIATFGAAAGGTAITTNVTDSMGIVHSIQFQRPTDQPIYMTITVLTDPTKFPADGAAQIKAALVAYIATFVTGQDVIYTSLFPVIFTVAGVVDVTLLHIGTSPSPPGSANIVIPNRTLASLITANVGVTVT